MKIKDLDLSNYSYKRICVMTDHGTVFMPENTEEKFFEFFGEEEINESGIEAAESGWLKIRPARFEK
jgi:hypothetical protein